METRRDALAALGEPTRRAIVELLADGPAAVGVLAARLPVSRPAVSQHLRVLEEAGVVRARAVGTRRLYALDPDGVAAARAVLDRFWDRALTDFADFAAAATTTPAGAETGPAPAQPSGPSGPAPLKEETT